jgi:hypothetical protein
VHVPPDPASPAFRPPAFKGVNVSVSFRCGPQAGMNRPVPQFSRINLGAPLILARSSSSSTPLQPTQAPTVKPP